MSLFELHGWEGAKILRRHSSEMILVGEPTLDSGASRWGTVVLAVPFLCCDVTLLLDDALHDAGLCLGQVRACRGNIVVYGIGTYRKQPYGGGGSFSERPYRSEPRRSSSRGYGGRIRARDSRCTRARSRAARRSSEHRGR